MFLLNKKQRYLGVDLGAGGVKIVELHAQKKRPTLYTYGLTSTPQDVHASVAKAHTQAGKAALQAIEQDQPALATADKAKLAAGKNTVEAQKIKRYAELVKYVCREAKTTTKAAVVSLPVSAVFHSIVTLPKLKKQEFVPVLQAEIKKLLPYPMEEASLDHQLLDGDKDAKVQRILVNAVPRSLVVFYTSVFQAAGLTLSALEPESAALTRALIGNDKAVTLIVDLGAERTNFFIIDEAVPLTHHSIELGGQKINKLMANILGIEQELVEQVKHDMFNQMLSGKQKGGLDKQKFIQVFGTVIDPVVKEIEVSLDLYLRQSGNESKRPEKVILTGGAAHFPYLAGIIADKFNLKSYIGDPFGRVIHQDSLRPLLKEIGPRLSVAIGLALRDMV